MYDFSCPILHGQTRRRGILSLCARSRLVKEKGKTSSPDLITSDIELGWPMPYSK